MTLQGAQPMRKVGSKGWPRNRQSGQSEDGHKETPPPAQSPAEVHQGL